MIFLRSVKFRLTLWYAVVLAILLSIFAFLMVAELSRVLYRDVDRALLSESEQIQVSMQSALTESFESLKEDDPRPYPFVLPDQHRLRLAGAVENWEKSTKRLSQSTLILRLLSPDGRTIASNLKGWERQIIFPDFERDNIFMEKGESYQTIHFRSRPIRLYYYLVKRDSRPLFIIQSGVSVHEIKRTLQRLNFIILIFVPGAVIAACVAGWFLAKRSFQPVDLTIRVARLITADYLKGRLTRTGADDELDRLAETLNEMMDRIENSTRAVQDFSSDISHELKTPLAIIRGEIDLALRRSRTSEALIETLRTIEGEVNELIRLVDDLMLLVRSDSKQLRFEMKPVSLADILRQVVSRYQDHARTRKISMTLQAGRDAVFQGDEVYLKRLFSNLLDNAIKFTPENGKVTVRLVRELQSAIVEVEDTGMGIAAELQTKVFSRFYRTDQARSHEGAGLGLNIAKAICEAHGGEIRIQSQPGQGTKISVIFTLPA